MPELFLIVCLAAATDTCEAISIPLETTGMMACMQEGQLRMVDWKEQHPEQIVKSWSCGRPPSLAHRQP